MSVMYTVEELQKIRQEAKRLNLIAPHLFCTAGLQRLQRICNGCGPESMPEWAREALTWVFRNYAAAHCIHDCDFELSDGTDVMFEEANISFEKNLLRIWEDRYGWTRWVNPVALWDRNKIRLAVKAVKTCGHDAWMECYGRNEAMFGGGESHVDS